MAGELYPAVYATIRWTGRGWKRDFAPPWVGLAGHIKTIPPNVLHDESAESWTTIVRRVEAVDETNKTVKVVFQLASRDAPHSLLHVGLSFGIFHAREAVWEGRVERIDYAPLDVAYWESH
jgi:hypothetical protein